MARYGSKKWKYDERHMMRLSEKLFAPKLRLKWKWKGTSFELRQGETVVWHSLVGAHPWDFISANRLAGILNHYINTPVDVLKRGDIAAIVKKQSWHLEEVTDNIARLVNLMIAADRRLGKNIQSVRLFTEPDRVIRNIIGSRL